MPLGFHQSAFKAAEATHCAKDQNHFWAMHERLFDNQRALEPFRPHAEALGLNVEEFEACMESGKYAEIIRQSMAQARKAGISGTPSFILARTDPDNPAQAKGLAFVRGAQAFSEFKSVIDKHLAEAK